MSLNGKPWAQGGIGCGIWKRDPSRPHEQQFNSVIKPVSANLDRYNLPKTTNQFAEAQALLRVLQQLDFLFQHGSDDDVDECRFFGLFIDSNYMLDCIFEHIGNWQEKAANRGEDTWQNSRNQQVIHQDILEKIMQLINKLFEGTGRTLKFYQCSSHQDQTCCFNRKVDELATNGTDK